MTQEFLHMNFKAAIRRVVALAQEIDKLWGTSDHLDRLLKLKELLILCLSHDHPEVRELNKLLKHLNENLDQKHFLGILIPLERSYGKGVADHDFLPIEGDLISIKKVEYPPIVVVLDNIRSAFNVGSIFRSAECFACSEIILCGYTATPDNDKIEKTTMGTEQNIHWSYKPHTLPTIQDLKTNGYSILGMEHTPKSISLWEYQTPTKVAIVLGNERHGLSPQVIDACDAVVHIPMLGLKNSLNVGVAFACFVNELRRQGEG